ncbi:hypothetical protein K402DRAFT_412573 [Aulographum hederae CBS 113979]|uniref:Uncharacterized protein n=1 Tax=Aulographum hederae CBS 113979 TaxID=1176131 RepID=A0A6G1H0K3_9PEZI|nr:hypothetical protein K402DRAFT_412573 [Aulographum hederae CBS 113979]
MDPYRNPQQLPVPHRKPLPQSSNPNLRAHPAASQYQHQPQSQSHSQQQPQHRHTRTSSSNILPSAPQPTPANPASSPYNSSTMTSTMTSTTPKPTRRTLSNATTTSNNINGAALPIRSNSNLSRSSSGRSGNSPISYVALMRKQKATVWCDRTQHEDPRIMAQQRAAKMRAAVEVVGGNQPRPVNTHQGGHSGGLRSKVRHGGAPKATNYAGNMGGTGVPMRLSANEVDEDTSEDANGQTTHHQRTGSGRSSLGSGRRVSSFGHIQGSRYSTSSTPPSGNGSSPSGTMEDLAEETPLASAYAQPSDYFAKSGATPTGLSSGSGSSGEREQGFGQLGTMPEHTRRVEDERKKSEDLIRRGSVDERTMTMSGVRLFVANPDLSD